MAQEFFFGYFLLQIHSNIEFRKDKSIGMNECIYVLLPGTVCMQTLTQSKLSKRCKLQLQ